MGNGTEPSEEDNDCYQHILLQEQEQLSDKEKLKQWIKEQQRQKTIQQYGISYKTGDQ